MASEMSFENVDDDGCLAILYALLCDFGSGELKKEKNGNVSDLSV